MQMQGNVNLRNQNEFFSNFQFFFFADRRKVRGPRQRERVSLQVETGGTHRIWRHQFRSNNNNNNDKTKIAFEARKRKWRRESRQRPNRSDLGKFSLILWKKVRFRLSNKKLASSSCRVSQHPKICYSLVRQWDTNKLDQLDRKSIWMTFTKRSYFQDTSWRSDGRWREKSAEEDSARSTKESISSPKNR